MMGTFMGGYSGGMGITFLIWNVVGVLAVVWLLKQISKKD